MAGEGRENVVSMQSLLQRLDDWNQRSIESAEERRKYAQAEAEKDFYDFDTDDEGYLRIQVLPTGYPVSRWNEADLVVLPFGWLRHRLFHQNEYSVVVSRSRRWTSIDRVVSRRSRMTHEEARTDAAAIAAELRG